MLFVTRRFTTGHSEAVRVLMAYGADAGLTDDKGRSPYRMACKWEFADHRNKAEIQDLIQVGCSASCNSLTDLGCPL